MAKQRVWKKPELTIEEQIKAARCQLEYAANDVADIVKKISRLEAGAAFVPARSRDRAEEIAHMQTVLQSRREMVAMIETNLAALTA